MSCTGGIYLGHVVQDVLQVLKVGLRAVHLQQLFVGGWTRFGAFSTSQHVICDGADSQLIQELCLWGRLHAVSALVIRRGGCADTRFYPASDLELRVGVQAVNKLPRPQDLMAVPLVRISRCLCASWITPFSEWAAPGACDCKPRGLRWLQETALHAGLAGCQLSSAQICSYRA